MSRAPEPSREREPLLKFIAWNWKPIVLLILVLVAIGYYLPASGFGATTLPNGDYIPAKTFWNWMEILLVPGVIAFGLYFLNQNRADTDRLSHEERSREEKLKDYIGEMTNLLLNFGLKKSMEWDEVRNVARTLTLTVLPDLNGVKKGAVVRFLYEAGLIVGEESIIDLEDADLEHLELDGCKFPEINLRGTRLNDCKVKNCNLSNATLSSCLCLSASFIHTALNAANFEGARLWGAKLETCHLIETDFRGAQLGVMRLGANLILDYWRVEFREDYKKETSFRNSVLDKANFLNTKISTSQLERAFSYRSVILPDGTLRD